MNIGYNSFNFYKDGKTWLPIMGEMHYSRTERKHWMRSLYDMKASGIEIVATYVIWIHHEEIENRYDFSGNKDLHEFAKCVKKAGLHLFLRIGPWVHGEVRNGGFPDWLFDKAEKYGFMLRRTNKEYLAETEKFYRKIYEQIDGLLLKDGGPIIGIQVENEHSNNCGGISGPEGDEHIRILTDMAVKIGFDVPIKTATAWGNAGTGDLLKVWGGYAARPWLPTFDELPPNPNYLFSFNRNDINIGTNELLPQEAVYSDYFDAPYATAELGGGCQITDRRRPIVAGKDVAALVLSKIGSGANLLGFYMYHGGTNPYGILTTLEETPNRKGVTGCLSTLPKFGYDFQAPIGEYGQHHECYAELRMLLLMIRDFGDRLCTMYTHLPKVTPKDENDLETLRTAIRHNGESGFLFVNNYQRRISMKSHKAVELKAELENETVTFPKVDIDDGQFFVWPVNMPVGNGILKAATATPLCKLNNKTYVFYGEHKPVFYFSKQPYNAEVIWITRDDALKAQKVTADKEYCIISDATVLATDEGIKVYSTEKPVLKVYPDFPHTPLGYKKLENDGKFAVYEKEVYNSLSITSEFTLVAESSEKKRYSVKLYYNGILPEDVFLDICYEGNFITVYVDGLVATDNYYNAAPQTVGLARYAFPENIEIEIDTLKADKKVYLQYDPRKNGNDACCLNSLNTTVKQLSYLEF